MHHKPLNIIKVTTYRSHHQILAVSDYKVYRLACLWGQGTFSQTAVLLHTYQIADISYYCSCMLAEVLMSDNSRSLHTHIKPKLFSVY